MRAVRQTLTLIFLATAVLLSLASTGHTDTRRLPVGGAEAYSLFPQLVAAAEELGYEAYELDDSVHVDIGYDCWIYFQVWQGRFSQTTSVPEDLPPDELADEERRVERAAREIWHLAMEYRAELYGNGPRRRSRR